MSVGVVNKTTGDRIQTAGDPLDKVGNLANLTTTAKDNAVNAINEVNAGLATKADLTDLAPAFSTSTAYTVGQYVSYDGNIYKCTSAHSAGAWVAGDFTLVAVGSELSEINSNIANSEKDIYAVMGEMGAKNLIPYPYYEDSEVEKDVTWTNNTDQTITATGTASADSVHSLSERSIGGRLYLKNGNYVLSGCPQNGSIDSYYMSAVVDKNGSLTRIGTDYGEGGIVTVNGDDYSNDGAYVQIRLVIKKNYAIQDSFTFKPMLRLASDTDDTYQQYAKTNKQLTDGLASVESGLDDVNSNLSSLNTFIDNNKLYVKRKRSLNAGSFDIEFERSGSEVYALMFGRYSYTSAELSMGIIGHPSSDDATILNFGHDTATVSCTGNTVTVTVNNQAEVTVISLTPFV